MRHLIYLLLDPCHAQSRQPFNQLIRCSRRFPHSTGRKGRLRLTILLSFRAHLDNCPLTRLRSQVGNRRWHSLSTDQHSNSIQNYAWNTSVLGIHTFQSGGLIEVGVARQRLEIPHFSTKFKHVINRFNLQKVQGTYLCPSSMCQIPCLNQKVRI